MCLHSFKTLNKNLKMHCKTGMNQTETGKTFNFNKSVAVLFGHGVFTCVTPVALDAASSRSVLSFLTCRLVFTLAHSRL